MRKILMAAAALGSALVAAAPAQAQDWDRHDDGNRGGWHQDGSRHGYGDGWRGNNRGDNWRIRAVCSGARADRLEDRLRREVREGDIDRLQARRINGQIDQLENRQRRECAERDWRSIQWIADRYDRIDRWIANESRTRW